MPIWRYIVEHVRFGWRMPRAFPLATQDLVAIDYSILSSEQDSNRER